VRRPWQYSVKAGATSGGCALVVATIGSALGRPEAGAPLVDVTAVHVRSQPILTNALMADYPSCEQSGFFAIARGSAMECAAVLDALLVLKVVDARTRQRGAELPERVVAMLTKLRDAP